jgi:hypothetical protein
MNCFRCQQPLVIGLQVCVTCNLRHRPTAPLECKYFVLVTAIIFTTLGLFGFVDGLFGLIKVLCVGFLGGAVWGSVFWLFYLLFRRH